VVVPLVLLAGGCGTEAEPRVATAQPGPSAAAASTAPSAGADAGDQALRFAECMREAGVDVADPDPEGRIPMRPGDKTDPDFGTAMTRCKPLLPKEGSPGQPPEFTPEQLETMRKYAQCMRDNGVPDFADPGPYGFVEPPRDQAAATRAHRACAHINGDDPDGPVQG
jgi:hypothetical protein